MCVFAFTAVMENVSDRSSSPLSTDEQSIDNKSVVTLRFTTSSKVQCNSQRFLIVRAAAYHNSLVSVAAYAFSLYSIALRPTFVLALVFVIVFVYVFYMTNQFSLFTANKQ